MIILGQLSNKALIQYYNKYKVICNPIQSDFIIMLYSLISFIINIQKYK